jgi:uncharacterized protein YndB with AHSA1/START domain
MSSISYEFKSYITIKIAAPLELVFNLAMDEELMKEWFVSPQLDFERIENVKGYKNEIGSQWHLVFSSKKGTKMKMLETITDYKENQKFCFELSDPFFRFNVKMLFARDGSKTVLSEELTGSSRNHFLNGMMRIFGPKSRKIKEAQYQRLKEIIESRYMEIKTQEEE